MMLNITLTLKLTLQGPILTQSTSAGGYGVDSPVARNSQGHCYIAGTLVKGRLRQSWEELRSIETLAQKPKIEAWLGNGTGNNEDTSKSFNPARGLLRFSDFVDEAKRESREIYRIAIDEARGAVRKGAHQSIESPYGADQHATFTGTIRFFASDGKAADEIKRWIEIGLRWTTNFGAERTVGFGRLVNVEIIGDDRPDLPTESENATGKGTIDLLISPQSPFCIARRRADNNLFESETVIPGGVLKGSVASVWLALLGKPAELEIKADTDPSRLELCRNFARLRFTHAYPMKDGRRAITAPLSLVKSRLKEKTPQGEKDKVRDVALTERPILLDDNAPSFDIDWKDRDDVDALFGWPSIKRELRVRTAIDREKRKAKKEQLFAYEMIVPNGIQWHARVDLDGVDKSERPIVEKQLREILRLGLHGLGKTKAHAEVQLPDAGEVKQAQESHSAARDGVWILTLQTPALLCDPRKLAGNNSSAALSGAYAETFDKLSSKSLKLKHFYARQSLAGGLYLHRRFQISKPYNPFLLTDAGSVFALEAVGDKAQSFIDDWLSHGLPLPEWVAEIYGSDWKSCPYLRENGYGEIAVNLDIHWNAQPRKGEYEDA
jgi:CRISPR/Cas system CSM-associated protein Csm3 (group 7 of RAMP superfamily)